MSIVMYCVRLIDCLSSAGCISPPFSVWLLALTVQHAAAAKSVLTLSVPLGQSSQSNLVSFPSWHPSSS